MYTDGAHSSDIKDGKVGLSTVPNRFCTAAESVELRKILMLSKGSRGGIVPSSTAVMDMYMVGKVVGVGSYGKVRAAWHRLTGGKVAIKTYDKGKLSDPAHWKRVHSEIKIMEQVSHPRIARMYEAVETPKRMHLIMECLDGGNLCSYVKAKKRLSEEESKRIFFQIAQAMDHLHSLGVSHRDVKLENVLFDNNRNIKLIDFGFSTVCQAGKKLKVFCGTPSYMAPEIVRRLEYEGRPVDIWSMGILLYALLCGCFPFRAKSYPDLYRRIARGTFSIPDELSAPVKDLLRQLLGTEISQRITSGPILRHPWLQQQMQVAPDVNRLRLETPILISDKPDDDLDDGVLDELIMFGVNKEEVVRQVVTKTHSAVATLYYLLLDTLVIARKNAVRARSSSNHSMQGKRQSVSSRAMYAAMGAPAASSSSSSSSQQYGQHAGHTQPLSQMYSGVSGGGQIGGQAAGATTKAVGGSAEPLSAHYMQATQSHQQRNYVFIGGGVQSNGITINGTLNGTGGQGIVDPNTSSRPRSASAGRPSSNSNRPLSAYAGRGRANVA